MAAPHIGPLWELPLVRQAAEKLGLAATLYWGEPGVFEHRHAPTASPVWRVTSTRTAPSVRVRRPCGSRTPIAPTTAATRT